MTRLLWLAFLLAWAAAPAAAADGDDPCRRLTFEGEGHTVCSVPSGAGLQLFLDGPDGRRLGGFSAVEAMLAERGERLVFGTNGGMYHPDRSPVGLYVEGGEQAAPLVTAAGPGNFGLKPNGVFCVAPDGRARVLTTEAFAAERPPCRLATQSGPMLVTGGALHPRFLPESSSRHVRGGVGVAPDGTVHVAVSDAPVNFHHFARLFRDALGAPDALYLDGKVTRLWAPASGRRDPGLPLGPMLGLVAPAG